MKEVVKMEMVYGSRERRVVREPGQNECQECVSGNYREINPRLLKVTFEGRDMRRITCARCRRTLHLGFFRRAA
jgi:hypothetical protein